MVAAERAAHAIDIADAGTSKRDHGPFLCSPQEAPQAHASL
jgi:hypothetical protein